MACRGLWACVRAHRTVSPHILLKAHSERTREALGDRSSLYFLWNGNPSSVPRMEEAPLPASGVLGGSKGVTAAGWALTASWEGEGEGFVPPGLSSPPSPSCAAEQGPEAPVLPTLWAPYSGGSAPGLSLTYLKPPSRCWERVPGLQNWKHRPRGEEGEDGAISSPFCPSRAAVTALPGGRHPSLGFLPRGHQAPR